MVKPIMNIDEVEFDDVEENGLYTSSRGQISDHIGARKLGYNLTVVPPGKAQWTALASCGLATSATRSANTTSSPARLVDLKWRTRSSTPARRQCATWRCRHLSMSRRASTRTPRRSSS